MFEWISGAVYFVNDTLIMLVSPAMSLNAFLSLLGGIQPSLSLLVRVLPR